MNFSSDDFEKTEAKLPTTRPRSRFGFHPRWQVSQVLESHPLTSMLSLPSPQKEPPVWSPITSAGLGSPCHCEIADKRFAEFRIATRLESPGGDPRWSSSQSSLSNLGVTPAAWVLLAAARVPFLYPEKSGMHSERRLAWLWNKLHSEGSKAIFEEGKEQTLESDGSGLNSIYATYCLPSWTSPELLWSTIFWICRMKTIQHFRCWSLA